ncbi:MAG: radical SAM protein [Patescibacteria group bacterium]
MLNIEKELGRNDIIGIDEAFPGEAETKNKIRRLIENDISEGKITALLFTLLLYNSERTLKYIEELKHVFGEKIKIIIGGQLVPLAREAYLKNKNIDAVCVGDAEKILPELLRDLEVGNLKGEYAGWVMNEKEKKFSGVSFDHFWQIKERMETQKKEVGFSQLTIQGPGGPGCAWAISSMKGPCSFCSLQNVEVKSEMTIEEYLENERVLEQQFHPDRFYDVANQFIPSVSPHEKVEWLKKYIEIRKAKGIKAEKYAYLTVPSVDAEVAELLKEAGISEVYLGIDHFSEEALKQENKSFRKRETLEKCLNALKSNGISFRAGIVLGSAEESLETLESVRNGVRWMTENYRDIIKAVGIFPIEMLPGSKDFEKMREAGLCPGLFVKFDESGYLSRDEQREMTNSWIDSHSNVSAKEVREFETEMFDYLKSEGVFGYSVDRKPEQANEFKGVEGKLK